MTVLRATSESAVVERAVALFKQTFGDGGGAPATAAAAPGRVNLIGEHTDYNEGYVLPLALEHRETFIVGRPREASGQQRERPTARLKSESFEAAAEFRVDRAAFDGRTSPRAFEPAWARYVLGMVAQFVSAGYDVPSFDAVLVSEVPPGGGVSSSAALEMACAVFLEQIAARDGAALDVVTRAKWGQRVEHEYVGVPSGIMDQLISASARAGAALLIDCRSLEMAPVQLDDPGAVVVVVNSNVKHSLADGEYGERRAACEQAAAAMGVASLRDADMSMLDRACADGKLGGEGAASALYRRARHVVDENARVLQAVEALRARQYTRFGELMYASHASLRDDFEVSCPELDVLVELAREVPGVYGSRMTGGGFGGCTVTLARAEAVDAFLRHIEGNYRKRSGRDPTCFVTRPGPGARRVSMPR